MSRCGIDSEVRMALCALALFVLTSLPVWAGVAVATYEERTNGATSRAFFALLQFDGEHYLDIANHGYVYDPQKPSTVAFFPVYPITASQLSIVFRCSVEVALVAVANISLGCAFVALGLYCHKRPSMSGCKRWQTYTVLSFGLLPTAVFFRMAYSEALFVLFVILVMYGIQRRWSILAVGSLCGVCTGIRPVGIGMIPPVLMYALVERQDLLKALRTLCWLAPVSISGIAAYMVYQYSAFGDALAFAKTQEHWNMLGPTTWPNKLLSLVTWEPIWSVYNSESAAFWGRLNKSSPFLLNLQFANPIYFCGTVALIGIGTLKQWLNKYEVALSLGLLAIPYFTRGYEMCMNSQGRFAAVVVPAFLVMGRILVVLPGPIRIAILGGSAIMGGIYAYKFGLRYPIF